MRSATTAAPVAPDPPARLQQVLEALQAEDQAHGSLAWQRGVAAPWVMAIGRQSLAPGQGDPQATTPATRYRIGSISKLITAILVLQMADDGLLDLDAPVHRWFPELPAAERMTVAHLLAHRGGLGEISQWEGFDSRRIYEPHRPAQLIAAIASLPRQFEPGEAARYSNAGYLVLSALVERLGGRDYGRVLQERLAQPLGLTDTAYDPRPGRQRGETRSYRWDEGGERWDEARSTDPSVPQGAGGVVSTPRDLAVLAGALFRGQLLKPATLARMTRFVDGFGLGLWHLPGPGPQAWGHPGTIDGFRSLLLYAPATDSVLVWCSHADRLPPDTLVETLRRAAFEPAARLPSYRRLQATVEFVLEPGRATPRQERQAEGSAASVPMGLRGNVPPLSWTRSLPLVPEPGTGRWRLTVPLTVRDGVPFEYKYLQGMETWERTPNRRWHGDPERPTRTWDVFEQDPAVAQLHDEILAQDARLFDAYNQRRADLMGEVFSERLEFFHDRTGLTGYADNLRTLAENFRRADAPRRRLLPGSEVQPLGAYGAVHLGSHQFCRDGPAGVESCQDFRFISVWERTQAGWRLARVVSIDH